MSLIQCKTHCTIETIFNKNLHLNTHSESLCFTVPSKRKSHKVCSILYQNHTVQWLLWVWWIFIYSYHCHLISADIQIIKDLTQTFDIGKRLNSIKNKIIFSVMNVLVRRWWSNMGRCNPLEGFGCSPGVPWDDDDRVVDCRSIEICWMKLFGLLRSPVDLSIKFGAWVMISQLFYQFCGLVAIVLSWSVGTYIDPFIHKILQICIHANFNVSLNIIPFTNLGKKLKLS